MILVNSFKGDRMKTCNKPCLTPSPALGAAKGAMVSFDGLNAIPEAFLYLARIIKRVN